MKLPLAGLLISAALPSRAALLASVPRIDTAPAPVMAGVLPSLAAPALLASPTLSGAPSLSAPSLAAAPAFAPALTVPLAAALAPAPIAAAPALAAAPAAMTAAASALVPDLKSEGKSQAFHNATERAALDHAFDGTGAASVLSAAPVPAIVEAAAAPSAAGWSRGSFESADGLQVSFKRRAGPVGKAPRVYSGGLALNESFDPLFARDAAPARPEYFLWTRGHRPTGWTATATPIDGDARDLARMIVLAARETGSPKVELALHSFGTLVFQRLVQLHAEPEVAAALRLLTGSRVVLLNATTHYEGSERRAGREFEQMGQATRKLVDMLNMMDQAAETWQAAASLNPFAGPAIEFWMAEYRSQRGQLMAMASQGATNMMKKDLAEPWDPAIDSIRRDFIAALKEDSQDHGWQESLLRRSSDMFRLEFTKRDAARIRRLHIHLDLIHASGDQLLNWESARTLFERLGIQAPENAPTPGTVLTDSTGRFRATIVDGDHYYPLKRRDDLARHLDP